MNKFSKAITIGLVLLTLVPSGVGAASSTNHTNYNTKVRYSVNGVLKREDIQKYIASVLNGAKQETAPKQNTVQDQKENTNSTSPSKTEEKIDTKPVEEKKDVPEQKEASKENSSLNAFEQEVINLTNQERAKNGLAPFKANIELSSVARAKSQDMINKNYFSHQSPTYGSPFDMMKSFGISYRTAGENIAKGQRTAQQVVNGWMNSEGHRKNILNPNFTEIGVGYAVSPSGTAHWTQMFIG